MPVRTIAFGALFAASVAFASLVDAAGGPARSSPPTVPYEDHGACPFECCTYRTWTVEADTDVRTDRKDSAPVVFRLRAGDQVDGLTGVVITRKLGKAIVRKPMTIEPHEIKLDPGAIIYIVNYVGEGAWNIWVRGHLYQAEISGKDQVCVGSRREPTICAVQIIEEPDTEWWAKVRNRAGKEGWTRDLNHFGNLDACG